MKFGKSIAFKVALPVTVVFCVLSLATSLVFSAFSNSSITKLNNDSFSNQVESTANKIDGWFSEQKSLVANITSVICHYNYSSDNLQEAEDLLAGIYDPNGSAYAYSLGFETGDAVFSDRWDAKANNYDPRTRDWYIQSLNTDEVLCTAPYIDAMSGDMIISVTKRLKSADGAVVGVFAADVNISTVVEFANGLTDSSVGYTVIVDANNNILVHKNSDYVPYVDSAEAEHYMKITDVIGNYSANEAIINVNDYDGSTRIAHQCAIGTTGWHILYMIDKSVYDATSASLIIMSVVVVLFTVITSAVLTFLVVSKALKPLKRVKHVVSRLSEGVLEMNNDYAKDDELGQFYTGLEDYSRMMKTYISDITEQLSRMEHGDFTGKFSIEYIGDFRAIQDTLKSIQKNLSSTILGMQSSIANVDSGSKQISGAAEILADGTVKQAASVEQLVGAVQNIAKKTQYIADNTNNTRELSRQITHKLSECEERMRETTDAMSNIDHSSNEIAKIIKVIEDIAFQTNILSLNASVEAARAGEQGKGFAVVAGEVRNLAVKSAEAAATTNKLIADALSMVSTGKTAVAVTGEAVNNVYSGVSSISTAIEEINAATTEQNALMQDVTQFVDGISVVVQSNSATAEQCAANSSELSVNANDLFTSANTFKCE